MDGRRNQSQMLRKYVDFRTAHKPVAGIVNGVLGSVRLGKRKAEYEKRSHSSIGSPRSPRQASNSALQHRKAVCHFELCFDMFSNLSS